MYSLLKAVSCDLLQHNEDLDANKTRNDTASLEKNISRIDQNKRKIDQLKEKLHMKLSALDAVKASKKQDDSKIIEVLDGDIKKIRRDISIYQTHIHKTQMWCENMGKWRTSILKARVTTDDSEPNSTDSILLFEIQVQLFESNYNEDDPNEDAKNAQNSRQFKEGWFIFRSIKQFEALHENLHDICSSDINKLFKKIPSLKRHLSGKHIDEDKMKKTTYILDDYLKIVSKDESLSQSEALYTFLCPSPDFYRQKLEKSNYVTNEEKFSISSIFRR